MASVKSATRYTNSLNSSTKSDPSSSAEFRSSSDKSRALAKKTDPTHVNFSSMVKKLVDRKMAKREPKFVVTADFLADDLKKNVKRGTGFGGLPKKLFKGSMGSSSGAKRGEESTKKALTEVKANTRTLAMVLRSERELLSLNKEHEELIAELKLLVEDKNREVEKLKDLCLKQREEIKSLKSAVLFPDIMNSHLQDLVEKQGSELKQAKQLIPSLQRQVTSLTGQLQCLAEDLAEVKLEKCSRRGLHDSSYSSPRTLSYDQEDLADSLFGQEFSSGDYKTPESPDDMFLKDLNPCLTPHYAKTNSAELDGYNSPDDGGLSGSNAQSSHDHGFHTGAAKLSKSSECCQSSRTGNVSARAPRRSNGRENQMRYKLF